MMAAGGAPCGPVFLPGNSNVSRCQNKARLKALEDLKKVDNADVVKQQANEILNTFLAADATFPLDDACLIESQVRTDCVTAMIQPCTDDNYVAHYKNIFAPILCKISANFAQNWRNTLNFA